MLNKEIVTKKGLSYKLNPDISEEIGIILKEAPSNGIIQPLHETPVEKESLDKNLYKGFLYEIFEGEDHNFKGFAARTIKHKITNQSYRVYIETSIRISQHEAGKELFGRIDAALEGYKYKYII